jgi:nitrate/nitrite transporter NarK
MYLLEGIPSVIVGLWVLAYLDDSIQAAKWLTADEKRLLERRIAEDGASKVDHGAGGVFRSGKVWLCAIIYFCFIMGLYGVSFWLPQLIKSMGVKDVLNVGLLTMIPYGVAAVVMVLAGRSSDRTGERRWHAAGAAMLGGLGLILAGINASSPVLGMASLTLATAGILASLPLFWPLPTAFLGGAAAAAGIAIINSLGNLAGFVSPFMVGAIKDATGSATVGLYAIAASLFVGAMLVLAFIPKPARVANVKEVKLASRAR